METNVLVDFGFVF